jgi:hypothetical protein
MSSSCVSQVLPFYMEKVQVNVTENVKLCMFMPCRHVCVCLYTYIQYIVWLSSFLNSALDGGEWLASRLGHFTPKEEDH